MELIPSVQSNIRFYAVQVSGHQIFQLKVVESKECFIMTLTDGIFIPQVRTERSKNVDWPSLCLFSERYVFSIGGLQKGVFSNAATKYIERHDLATNMWEAMPSLNMARYRASSCILNQTLYVFVGLGDYGSFINTVEKMDLSGSDAGKSSRWELF